jgi:hypothetical protein
MVKEDDAFMSETKTKRERESLSHSNLPIAQRSPSIIHQPFFTEVVCSRVQPFLYEHQEVN